LYHCTVVIGSRTAELVKDEFLLRELDTIRVKGIEAPVTVYEPVAEHPVTPEQMELVERYREALAHYRARRFADAATIWEALAQSKLEPGRSQKGQRVLTNPSAMMTKRARDFERVPPPSSWNSVWELTSK
ncbi:MAG: hypothetical protein ACREJ6_07260, partial [Candidatus Methylomirabilis sp.]